MKVIVNADDFGYSKGQNIGILESFKDGIVSSTSLMVNMEGFEHAIKLMKENKELSVGIHLVMTASKPILKGHKTIVDKKGFFIRDMNIIEKADPEEIKREYKAQVNKFLDTGFKPTHIDFHVGATYNQYLIAIEIAKELNIPLRGMNEFYENLLEKEGVKHSKNFIEDFYDEGVSLENLKDIFKNNKDKNLIEIMTHPAYVDYILLNGSSYNIKRAEELKILTSKELKEFIKSNNIELVSYKNI
ncbi:chitin disaccharide deacetylase [Clostridium chrysemydis]|uniref:chitin disaccharide deacetylase n=1 Tax=Clostridium chrysemydis TaxID=2665504 RepID=UPI001883574E|nr:chitin disaccharide deacetylase [Clostridium chrysemydis]